MRASAVWLPTSFKHFKIYFIVFCAPSLFKPNYKKACLTHNPWNLPSQLIFNINHTFLFFRRFGNSSCLFWTRPCHPVWAALQDGFCEANEVQDQVLPLHPCRRELNPVSWAFSRIIPPLPHLSVLEPCSRSLEWPSASERYR